MSSADYLAAGAARMAVLDKRIDWRDTSDEKPARMLRSVPKPGPRRDRSRGLGQMRRIYDRVRYAAGREIRCESREACVVLPRHIAMWLQRKATKASWHQIARFWLQDHVTVIHGVRKIDLLRESDQAARLLTDWWLRKLAAVDALDAARRQA